MVLIHVFLYYVLNSVKKKKMISKAVHVLEGHTSRRRGVSVCVCGVLVRLPLAKSNTI